MIAKRFAQFAAITLAVACAPAFAEDAPARKPDIIVIMIDTLRADRLGCYGNPLETSPTLDAIAEEGVLFTDAVAPAPWTCPSIASVFTSLYPSRHRVFDHEGRYARSDNHAVTDVLGNEHVTLAEGLRTAGYETAAFIANRWLQPEFGFAQGFDTYDMLTARSAYPPGKKVNKNVAAWLAGRDTTKPLFLYVHYMDVHGPYNSPAQYRAQFVEPLAERLEQNALRKLPDTFRGFSERRVDDLDMNLRRYVDYWVARYDAGIRYCDDHVAELKQMLTDAGIWNDATVVVVADHGEELVDHGGSGHGYNIYGHQLQVPLVFRGPWVSGPRRISATVSLVDLAATLWELAATIVPVVLDGRSLVPILSGAEPARSTVAFGQAVKKRPDLVSAQMDGRKLILNLTNNVPQYYDLRTDANEQAPSDEPPDNVAAQLRVAITRWVGQSAQAAQAAEPPPPRVEIDPETERILKSLGYLQDADE